VDRAYARAKQGLMVALIRARRSQFARACTATELKAVGGQAISTKFQEIATPRFGRLTMTRRSKLGLACLLHWKWG